MEGEGEGEGVSETDADKQAINKCFTVHIPPRLDWDIQGVRALVS